jgi:hypothetical protein
MLKVEEGEEIADVVANLLLLNYVRVIKGH